MRSMSPEQLIITAVLLLLILFLYTRHLAKQPLPNPTDTFLFLQDYIADKHTAQKLDKGKKPVLWIHVPYAYNSRNWHDFGSRSSFELNQPYLYLTARSIIQHCDQDFIICIIDDFSFARLLPNWTIAMNKLASPILENARMLGLMRLLYMYGGLICPISFICMHPLIGLYDKYSANSPMFVLETIDRNSSFINANFAPNVLFCGAPKASPVVKELCDLIARTISADYTADTRFIGRFDEWARQHGQIAKLPGTLIGSQSDDGAPIVLDDLMSNHYLRLDSAAYGIYVPADELLSRVAFGWFSRMSPRQVMESDTMLGNYLMLALGSFSESMGTQSSVREKNKEIAKQFVGFWKVPLDAPVWSLKPDLLGDAVPMIEHPVR